ncbi:MAG: hypothetical protein L0210_02650 [Rhodospirillales bacterium]|nr:hypothetical protein [Rhodospirillales bacterium]
MASVLLKGQIAIGCNENIKLPLSQPQRISVLASGPPRFSFGELRLRLLTDHIDPLLAAVCSMVMASGIKALARMRLRMRLAWHRRADNPRLGPSSPKTPKRLETWRFEPSDSPTILTVNRFGRMFPFLKKKGF